MRKEKAVPVRICLVIPSLKVGGMERVMSEVANYLAEDPDLEVHLVLLTPQEIFFAISPKVIIHRPEYKSDSKIKLIFKFGTYLRKKLKKINPYAVLSFGSMYNSFVLLFSLGLNLRIFVSDRSNPYRNTKLRFGKDPVERHDGWMHYILKKVLYKKAAGILVQTEKAREIEAKYSGHRNIILFPNPIRNIEQYEQKNREQWILNVGRFIKTKNQLLLLELFSRIQFGDWKLVFAGEGPYLEEARERANELNITESVIFLGNVPDIDRYLHKSEIFAFPSISEGFPNALAEAMKASLACIAYDCVAGPSDLIQHGVNGYLIPVGNEELFEQKLSDLMHHAEVRQQFQCRSAGSVAKYEKSVVVDNLKKELVYT